MDDAYLGADVVRIGSQVTGPVSSVSVHSRQAVRRGDLLCEVDPALLQELEAQREKVRRRATQAAKAQAARKVAQAHGLLPLPAEEE